MCGYASWSGCSDLDGFQRVGGSGLLHSKLRLPPTTECVCVSWQRAPGRTGHTWTEEFKVWFPFTVCYWGLTIHGHRSPFQDWQDSESLGSGSLQGHSRMEFPSASSQSIFCLSQGSWTENSHSQWGLVVLFFLLSGPTLWLLTHSLCIHSFSNFFSIRHIPGMVLGTAEQKRKLPVELLLFSLSVVSDSFATPWTVACQAPLSIGFPRQEYWSGLPFPSPGIFPTQGSNPGLQHLLVDSLPWSHQGSPTCTVTHGYVFCRKMVQLLPILHCRSEVWMYTLKQEAHTNNDMLKRRRGSILLMWIWLVISC